MAGEYAPNVEGTWIGGGGDAMGTFVPSAPGGYVDIGGGGDQSNVVFVPNYVPQAPQPAPGYLRPEDYVAAGFAPSGQPTPESIKAYENAVASQDIALQQTGLMQTGVAPFGIRKAPDWLPKGSYNLLGYDSAGNKTGDPLLDVPQNMAAKVMAAYQNILGRNATQAELLHHVDVFSKKPDDYQWWLGSLSESPESTQRVATGQTNWDTVEKNARLLSQGYGFWTPTEESWWQKATNTVGSAIPYAGLGIMTGGLGAAAGLGGIASGALAGGVTGAARSGIEGGNFGRNVLTGAALGGATGGALEFLGSSLPATSSVSSPLASSGGLDLGTGFTFPTYEDQLYNQFTNAFANPTELGAGTTSAQVGGGSYLPSYSSGIQEGTTYYTDPITGEQIPVELAVPQATSSTVSGTGTEGVAQTYVSGPNEYVGLPDGTFIQSNVETGVETIVDSLPKDAVLVNAGDGVSPINGANTFSSLTTGEILSGAGGAAALAALLNSLGVGSGGPGAGANGEGPGTGGGGTGTGGGGTGTGTGGTGTGGTGTGKGGGGVPKVPVPSALPKLLKNPVLYQSAPGGLYRGNQNPFTFGKDVPIQNPFENYDPFAALNVPQSVPKSDADLLANLLREHIYG